MNDNYNSGFPGEKTETPPMLKTLTVLSIIGSILQIASACSGFFFSKKAYEMTKMGEADISNTQNPSWLKNIMGNPAENIEKARLAMENRVPLLILGLLAAGLCLYGVLQMRKLNKQGFTIYVIGQILPFITLAIFIGSIAMKGFGFYFEVFFALLFITLYLTQKKYLTKE